jgi:NTP pyrophosphatase (non-canonical NTP hydrolase)
MQITNSDLQNKLTLINAYFAKNRPEIDHKTMVLGRVAKIAEEFGELSNEVLSSIGFQRQSKLDQYERKHLEEEYADTLLALLLLGNYLEIDTNTVLSQKLSRKLQDFGLK